MKNICLFAILFSSAATAQLTVSGDIPAPLTITAGDLTHMPRRSVTIDEHNSGKVAYEGVPLYEILKKAGVPTGKDLRGKALAAYVVATGKDGYQVVFSVGELDPELANTTAIIADKREGKPLPEGQGPLRMVVPEDKRPARSVRMLQALRIMKVTQQ